MVIVLISNLISEKRAANFTGSLAERLGCAILVNLPVWQLLILAAALRIVWAASLFDMSFVAKRHAFCKFPGEPSAVRSST